MAKRFLGIEVFRKVFFISFLVWALVGFSGCISPKTDAFLLGAGIGAGTTAYFLNGGSIAGYSLRSFQNRDRNPTAQQYRDFSIPSELEWQYMGEEIFSEEQLQQAQAQGKFY
ncbi:hypothetical protein [Helicobacter winghamensis]|uniref:Lipoprotein n=1 Tax=Helicobacter winghamensis TaxID=157268 RepID=A0A2N3PIY1_9HELI|nr:hypothetical protein [Helicobacter winghamensis]PKT76355.1 hypothetical protein BCM35_06450 [Helicobacter winghamensis]PKT76486.1 hypothetical protein BCM32_03605 [Helicobacter winghamensis]PKT76617.1 hypothetical protein BCM34_04980 [Helicobacter winghamensis]PKT80866.1 hypothetical protein BCM31_02590 [Helicobacter winghamensis]PKT81281.1 hypothetical protein BCM33_05195 [Helicobacter winghamensis]